MTLAPLPLDAQSAEAAAQALFADAKSLMKKHAYKDACPKLEEVLRLEPKGNGARMMLAECYESDRRYASAWATYLAAGAFAKAAGQGEREKKAEERAKELSSKLSRVRVVVAPALASLTGLVVRRDDVLVGKAQWGEALPVDGGRHVVTATAPERTTHRREIDVADEGAEVVVEIGEAELPRAAPPPASSAAPPASAPPAASSVTADPSGTTTPSRRRERPGWALPALGAGAGLGVAAFAFYLDLRSVQSRQDRLCGGDLKHCARTSPAYDPAPDNARKQRDFVLAVGLGGVGAALLAAGAYGVLGTPKVEAVAAPSGLLVRGTF